MNIILEGPDAVGKTTLAEKLRDKYGMSIHHSTSKTRNDLYYHLDLLDYRSNTVFDRFNAGESVYPEIYDRPPKLNENDQAIISRRIIDNNDLFIIFITSDMEIINKRLIERGEEDYIPEMTQQNELFTKFANKFNAKYRYKNFCIVDIAEEDAYNKLDAWIEEHFGKITVNIAYKKLANDLLDYGHRMETRNVRGTTKELCNYSFTINDLDDECVTLTTGKSDLTYLAAELLWYWSSRNDLEFINKFSTFWSKVTDDGVTANSAYGYILQEKHGFNQIEKIIELLRIDPYSRRAVLNINIPNENVIETKDEMCTICINYQIRDNKLHSSVLLRSNDMWFGARNDIPFFISLQKYIARKLNIEVGTYYHEAYSMHFYSRDFDKVKSVAYGTLETIDDRLDISKLLDYREKLVDWIDNKFTSREDFTKMLRNLHIIHSV